jgi:putative ABC transport system substrate-binding protein
MRRIGVLLGTAEGEGGQTLIAVFFARLEELGWKRGRNINVDVHWWNGGPEQMRPIIGEMLAASPECIMVWTNLALAALKPMVGNVPVVFVGIGDPVGSGFVASLAHPGGNITGFASYDGPMGGKWLEVLKETAPQLMRIMTILHPETPVHQAFWRSIEDAAPRFGVEAIPGAVHDAAEIESAISAFAVKENSGLIVLPHALSQANERLLTALPLRFRLPAIYATAGSAMAGGLVSYSLHYEDSFRHTAEYVDRILRGEKPSDLPVQEPTKFDLAFNLKTAKALGLTIRPTLLARADEVIE